MTHMPHILQVDATLSSEVIHASGWQSGMQSGISPRHLVQEWNVGTVSLQLTTYTFHVGYIFLALACYPHVLNAGLLMK